MVAAVEAHGAVAGITAVVGGVPTVGLEEPELARFLDHPDRVAKLTARDVPWAMARGLDGATTVAASLLLAERAGVRVFATGGIGGVHRGAPVDESADLWELARTPLIVVCSGAKAILDLRATFERLETLGIPVVGYRTSEFPAFFSADSGIPLGARVERASEIVEVYAAQRSIGRPAAMLVVQAPPKRFAFSLPELEGVVRGADESARAAGVTGAALTPYLLDSIRRQTGDRSLDVNLALLEANAALAAEIAALRPSAGHVPDSICGASGTQGAGGAR